MSEEYFSFAAAYPSPPLYERLEQAKYSVVLSAKEDSNQHFCPILTSQKQAKVSENRDTIQYCRIGIRIIL